MEPQPAMRALFGQAHDVGATALLILILMHVAAALFHHLVLRDEVLHRMLPRFYRLGK